MRLLLFALALASASAQPDFTRDVQPIFQQKCIACHGPAMQMNGLRLDNGEAALRGGNSGPAIKPGDAAQSPLLARLTATEKGKRMPPAGAPLTTDQIATLKTWIDGGAKWPLTTAAKADPRRSHWAYQPIKKSAPPAVKQSTWLRNPIDSYVLARLEKENIQPSPEATRTTLLRRVKLDLLGFPPTPQEVTEWLADTRPDTYERWVDRFLQSPHYGERWARPWLDLAHYADSDGYEKDSVRPYAWRFRHWLINALNADMPFDQFTTEQLAGDLLPSSTQEQRVATGFLRNTLINREAGVDRREDRFEQVINRVNTVGTTWLGVTIGCTQCHDHKYDPFSQKEYYSMFAFFNAAEDADIDAPLPGELGPYLQAVPAYRKNLRELLESNGIPELQAKWETAMLAAMDNPGKEVEIDFNVTSMRAMLDFAERMIRKGPANRTQIESDRLTAYFLSAPGALFSKDKEASAKLKAAREKSNELAAKFPALTQAQAVHQRDGEVITNIALRGDWKTPGMEVQPAALSVLHPMKAQGNPTRLDLARWLVAKENPLTPRVIANRAWQEFFGQGIVRTSEDLGLSGERPSHPELLEWLASDFWENGMSMKRLHKTIVMSATYRQASTTRPELNDTDPGNTLLARQTRLRLPAELIRDAALQAGGILNPAIGGKSIKPMLPKGVAELGYGNSIKWKQSEGMEAYRRGLYIHFQRTTPYPQLMNFDEPDSNVACSRRRASNTPLQALNLLNDPVFVEAAAAIGERSSTEFAALALGDRIDQVFTLCMGRRPVDQERASLAKFIDRQSAILAQEGKTAQDLQKGAWAGLARVLMNLDEFITRE